MGSLSCEHGSGRWIWGPDNIAAEIFNIEILIVSSLGPDATAVITPTSTIPMAQIKLGYFAEGDGEHYVCVEGDFHSDEQSIEDIDNQLLENRPEEEQE